MRSLTILNSVALLSSDLCAGRNCFVDIVIAQLFASSDSADFAATGGNLFYLALPPPPLSPPLLSCSCSAFSVFFFSLVQSRRRCTCLFFFSCLCSREGGCHTSSGLPRQPHYLHGHKTCELRDDRRVNATTGTTR